jgi:8-oxo-dGTP diphosphatase
MLEPVRLIDLAKINQAEYKKQFVGCLVLTKDCKILLQQRGPAFPTYPNYLSEFGGHIEEGEQPIQTMIRELKEELGASLKADELIHLGVITEKMSLYKELIYTYFWHDVYDTITGCYEGKAKYFENISPILAHPKITDVLRWILFECQKRGFLNNE